MGNLQIYTVHYIYRSLYFLVDRGMFDNTNQQNVYGSNRHVDNQREEFALVLL